MEENKVNVNEEENVTVDQDIDTVDQQTADQQPTKRKYGFGETVVHYGKKGVRAVGRGLKKAAPVFFGICIGAGGALGICTALAGRKNYIDYNNDLEPEEIIDGEVTAVEDTVE